MNRKRQSNGSRLPLAWLIAGCFVWAAQAATLHVPSEYPTIQAAIDAAVNGDEIRVADGTYTGPGNRDISLMDKAITVRSANGPAACIIDCQATEADPHRAFFFQSGKPQCVIQGFTVQNGYAPQDVNIQRLGGAVYCVSSSPLIQECVFQHNRADFGGALFSWQAGGPSVIDCAFFDNTARDSGGAIHSQALGDQVLDRCTFLYNRQNNPDNGGAAGVAALNGTYTVTNCRFIRNSGVRNGGGAWFRGAQATVTNCVFEGNSVAGPTSDGGGAAVTRDSQATFTNCVITANSASGGSHPSAALWVGDGLGGPAYATFANCTFSHNMAMPVGAALVVTQTSHADVGNCVFSNDTPNPFLLTETGTIAVSYSNVQGGWPGTGNIDADPLFVRNPSPGPDGEWGTEDDDYGNLRLTVGSPCIDAGDPAFHPAPCAHDLAGACRAWDGNADTLVRVDMGVYEFAAPLGVLDGDCVIGLSDLTTLLANFGGPGNPDDGDLNGDGAVDLADLSTLLSSFGSTCP